MTDEATNPEQPADDAPAGWWVVVINGKRFRLADLPVGEVDEIAKRHAAALAAPALLRGVPAWALAVDNPNHYDLGLGLDFLVAAARHLEEPLPAPLTLEKHIEMFVFEENDLPPMPPGPGGESGPPDPTNGESSSTPG